MASIFISHAAVHQPLAEHLRDGLLRAAPTSDSEVFLSSKAGQIMSELHALSIDEGGVAHLKQAFHQLGAGPLEDSEGFLATARDLARAGNERARLELGWEGV